MHRQIARELLSLSPIFEAPAFSAQVAENRQRALHAFVETEALTRRSLWAFLAPPPVAPSPAATQPATDARVAAAAQPMAQAPFPRAPETPGARPAPSAAVPHTSRSEYRRALVDPAVVEALMRLRGQTSRIIKPKASPPSATEGFYQPRVPEITAAAKNPLAPGRAPGMMDSILRATPTPYRGP